MLEGHFRKTDEMQGCEDLFSFHTIWSWEFRKLLKAA